MTFGALYYLQESGICLGKDFSMSERIPTAFHQTESIQPIWYNR